MSKLNSKLFKDDPAAYYTELGAEAERERIIKLLEENSANYLFCKCDTCERERFLIALIKGEQK